MIVKNVYGTRLTLLAALAISVAIEHESRSCLVAIPYPELIPDRPEMWSLLKIKPHSFILIR